MNRSVKTFLAGATAGVLATAPMSLAMALQHHGLPFHKKRMIPPKKITMRIAKRLGIARKTGLQIPFLNKTRRNAAAVIGHFGYGAATGALYPAIRKSLAGSELSKGISYGLMVWYASYRGWLPGARVYSPEEHPHEIKAIMVLSHAVWGLSCGFLYPMMSRLLKQNIRA